MNKIKVIALDIDGTLTDGSIIMSAGGEYLKVFNVKDGYAIKQAINSGIKVFFITGRKASPATIARMQDLEISLDFLKDSINDKVKCAENILDELNLSFNEMAYMGDDIPDLNLIKKVGFSGCPSDAIEKIREAVNFISIYEGGFGAVREFIDLILQNRS